MELKFLHRYRHLLPSVLLFGGFLVDLVTFRTLQLQAMLLLSGGYALAAAFGLALGERGAGPLRTAVPVVTRYAFGKLLCLAFLFYWFGGTIAASWPLLLAVAAIIAFSETFRHVFLRPAVQFGGFAFVLASYGTLLFPFLLRSIDPWAFLLGGAAATAVTLLLGEIVTRTDAARRPLAGTFRLIALGTYAVFASAYFLNVIPPIPLAIREAGAYHDVRVQGGEYLLASEPENFFARLWPGQTLHLEKDGDGRIYAYAAIFAPENLSTTIVHDWQRYDETTKRWVDAGRSTYEARGGRDDGYRGYSYRTIREPGRWRVIIETARGQELGRIRFTVIE